MIIVMETLNINMLARSKLLGLGHEKFMVHSLLELIFEPGIHPQTSGNSIGMILPLSPNL